MNLLILVLLSKIYNFNLQTTIEGRHSNRPKEDRKCKFCKVFVEDEYHFLMSCPLYQDLRKTFLPGYFLNVVNYHNFVTLMNTQDGLTIRNLAMFIYYAFERRNDSN